MPAPNLTRILDRLEKHYGKLRPVTPLDPYEMVIYANCGYPANDVTCAKGYAALKKQVGTTPEEILAASGRELAQILKLGGIVPELRAQRLKEIAARVQKQHNGDLAATLRKSLPEARKALKQFPTIGDPGAEKILLFTKIAAIPAVPSNCTHVPLRLGIGTAYKSYSKDYRSAQESLRAALPETREAYLRAYLLLQQHGQELCKRSRPKCDECPITADCRYFNAVA
jgi:endonuclease-3